MYNLLKKSTILKMIEMKVDIYDYVIIIYIYNLIVISELKMFKYCRIVYIKKK